MLPADHGDAILLEYGPGRRLRYRVLIDGGAETAYRDVRERLRAIRPDRQGRRRIDLLVISHVDGDHIEGVVKMLQDDELALAVGDVWFNDWNHLEPLVAGTAPKHLGPEQGEFLGALLVQQGRSWNRAFAGGTIVAPPAGRLPVRRLGGMRFTIVSPTIDTLIALRQRWRSAIEAAGFEPGSREKALEQFAARRWAKAPKPSVLGDERRRKTLDHSVANGSSIAVIAEYRDRRLLLAADAHADVLRQAIERWRDEEPTTRAGSDGRVDFDVFKLSHHGSSKNLTPQLLDVITCPTYLVSSSGRRFRHPDVDTVKMLVDRHPLTEPPVVGFNYRSPQTEVWAHRPELVARFGDESTLSWETA